MYRVPTASPFDFDQPCRTSPSTSTWELRKPTLYLWLLNQPDCWLNLNLRRTRDRLTKDRITGPKYDSVPNHLKMRTNPRLESKKRRKGWKSHCCYFIPFFRRFTKDRSLSAVPHRGSLPDFELHSAGHRWRRHFCLGTARMRRSRIARHMPQCKCQKAIEKNAWKMIA